MTKRKEIYKCNVCGNIVEILHKGEGELICCKKPMILMKEITKEIDKTEKHKPIIKDNIVKVGSIEHPMTPEHYIEWIEATSESGQICKKFLNPNENPEVNFEFKVKSARSYCNLHLLWKN
ncbi:desulfoferrodoxin FeS4 iron-binding domain-containing protein [Candidatus Pacearchaeota archaeon]|nr:desulfoferrodoxin FeS4 iron-binding domain-containing protein [Candidatus Pacearchaeota archaeon]